MPVRSLRSSVLRWPDAREVDRAVRQWAAAMASQRHGIAQIGYFGSYARGDWGVGSDVDLVVVLECSDQPFERRAAQWDTSTLPVPADLLIYTTDEWQSIVQQLFGQRLLRETVWVSTVAPQEATLCVSASSFPRPRSAPTRS
ncbi:MAG: nucleotidyltransferase domain-containing protein [Chloroflexi bacterium]|nr:nucleotidyltransferase domain-containing protein [Chloroflexota bacterium]